MNAALWLHDVSIISLACIYFKMYSILVPILLGYFCCALCGCLDFPFCVLPFAGPGAVCWFVGSSKE